MFTHKKAILAYSFLIYALFLCHQVNPQDLQDTKPPQNEDLVRQTMAMDISTADYYSLVAWAKSLELAYSGTAQDIRARLYQHYKVSAPPSVQASKKTITIQSADSSEYISAKNESESLVHFRGRVVIKVKDDDTGENISIQADDVYINSDANILSARGHIIFEKTKPDGTDYFMGDTLDLTLDDYSGIFLDGKTTRKAQNAKDKITAKEWYFRASEMEKHGTDVFILKDGKISSCDDEQPHYSIRASKFWILGGNEWAMSNATLSVGEVPLAYLPFFYYPGEEIVFNPVFGYEHQLGRFVQTTTYFIGEKEQKKDEASLFSFMNTDNKYDRKLEGIFLISQRKEKKNKTSNFVKLLADIYSTFGGFVGVDAKWNNLPSCTSLTLFAGLGLSRSTVALNNGSHTQFFEAGDYKSVWNTSYVFGTYIPIRFGLNLAAALDFTYVKLNLAFPFYSDPYFNQDFTKRSETMNWLKFMDDKKDKTSISKITSFTDSITASASVPSSILPSWISNINIPKFSTALTWTTLVKTPPSGGKELSLYRLEPSRDFFAPSELVYIDTNASLSGTIYRYPMQASAKPKAEDKAATDKAQGTSPENQLITEKANIPSLVQPWTTQEKADLKTTSLLPDFIPPPLAVPESITNRQPFAINIDWSLQPSVLWKRGFLTAAWNTPAMIDWKAMYETLSIRNAATINLSTDIYGGLFKISSSISASTQYQARPVVSKNPLYVSPALLSAWMQQDASYRNDKITASLKLSSFPFQDIWFWSPTNISYTINPRLYERLFSSMNPAYPNDVSKAIYKTFTPEWTKDSITGHNLALDIGIRPWGYNQTLTLAANLPPSTENYSIKLTSLSPWTSFSISTALTKPKENGPYEWSPLTSTLVAGFAPWPILTTTFIWDIKNNEPSAFTSAFSWSGLTLSLTAKKDTLYKFDINNGWIASGKPEFRVSSMDMSYSLKLKPPASWYKRILWTLDLDMTAHQNFLRFVNSYMDVKIGFTFKLHEFLDLNLSAASQNSALWLYYPKLFNLPFEVEALNPLFDIIDSFNFFDVEARKNAQFKLKSISLGIVHYMHDWNLSATMSILPTLDKARNGYVFTTNYSIMLTWNAMAPIKTSVKKENNVTTWN